MDSLFLCVILPDTAKVVHISTGLKQETYVSVVVKSLTRIGRTHRGVASSASRSSLTQQSFDNTLNVNDISKTTQDGGSQTSPPSACFIASTKTLHKDISRAKRYHIAGGCRWTRVHTVLHRSSTQNCPSITGLTDCERVKRRHDLRMKEIALPARKQRFKIVAYDPEARRCKPRTNDDPKYQPAR